MSELEMMRAKAIAFYEAELTFMRDKVGHLRNDGKEPDPEFLALYGQLDGHARRNCEAIGYQRRPRDITSSLAQYMIIRAQEQASADEANTEAST